jgi:hypothetical protein
VVWFTVLAGCYALFIPVIQDAAAQAAVAVLYTAAAIATTATYFIVRQVACLHLAASISSTMFTLGHA